MYEKYEMDIVRFEENNAFVIGMSDGGSEYNPWNIKPDRSDS